MSPKVSGGFTLIPDRKHMHSFNLLLAIGASVLTGRSFRTLSSVFTVLVRTRIGDLNSRRCVIQELTNRGHLKIIQGHVPLSEMFGYATSVRSLSQGRATYTMEPHTYQEVPKMVAEKIIAG